MVHGSIITMIEEYRKYFPCEKGPSVQERSSVISTHLLVLLLKMMDSGDHPRELRDISELQLLI